MQTLKQNNTQFFLKQSSSILTSSWNDFREIMQAEFSENLC